MTPEGETQLFTSLGRIETKIDEHTKTQEKINADVEARLRKHEKWHYVQLAITGISHGAEHMGGLMRALLAVIKF